MMAVRFAPKSAFVFARNFARGLRRFIAGLGVLLISVGLASAANDSFLDPTRPSVSESATVQRAGVLQIDFGADIDFDSSAFRSQAVVPLGLRYAVNDSLRLDLDVDTVASEQDRMGVRETGFGDTGLGFKAIIVGDPETRLASAISYTVKLPTASDAMGLGSGRVDHDLRFILNRKFGKTDYVFNVSYLNIGRDDSSRRASGALAVFAVARELPKNFGVLGEVYGQSVDGPAGERGAYGLGAVTYQLSERLRFDAGVRFGFGSDAPNGGLFVGLTTGIDLRERR